MTDLVPIAAALHRTFNPADLDQLHQDAVTVQHTVTDTEPWGLLVDALFIAAHPRDGQLDVIQVDLGYLDALTAERDRLKITSRTHLLAYDHLNAVTRNLIDALAAEPAITTSMIRPYQAAQDAITRPLESYLSADELAMINGPRPKINAEGGGVLGSPRRAQDRLEACARALDLAVRGLTLPADVMGRVAELGEALRRLAPDEAEAVGRYEGALASGLSDAEAREDGWPSPPVPSQGQDIPADQLQALIAEATHIPQTDAYRHLAVAGYRVGYAAALGYEIEVIDGRVGVGDRPEAGCTQACAEGHQYDERCALEQVTPQDASYLEMLHRAETAEAEVTRLRAERDEALQDYRDVAPRLEKAERALLDERYEHRQTSAAEDEARETIERLQGALTIAHRHLRALDAHARYGSRFKITDSAWAWTGDVTILGFDTEQTAQEIGVVLSTALARHVGGRVDATLIHPAKLGDPQPLVDVEELLAETRVSLAAAVTDADREEAVEELLEGWYRAWPDTAVTSPHMQIAGELVRLLAPGPVTLTIPADLWAGLAQRIRAGHAGPAAPGREAPA